LEANAGNSLAVLIKHRARWLSTVTLCCCLVASSWLLGLRLVSFKVAVLDFHEMDVPLIGY